MKILVTNKVCDANPGEGPAYAYADGSASDDASLRRCSCMK